MEVVTVPKVKICFMMDRVRLPDDVVLEKSNLVDVRGEELTLGRCGGVGL